MGMKPRKKQPNCAIYIFTDVAEHHTLVCGPGGWSFCPIDDPRAVIDAFKVAGKLEAQCFTALRCNEGFHIRCRELGANHSGPIMPATLAARRRR